MKHPKSRKGPLRGAVPLGLAVSGLSSFQTSSAVKNNDAELTPAKLAPLGLTVRLKTWAQTHFGPFLGRAEPAFREESPVRSENTPQGPKKAPRLKPAKVIYLFAWRNWRHPKSPNKKKGGSGGECFFWSWSPCWARAAILHCASRGTKEKICPVEVDSPKRKHGDGQKTCLNIGVLL